MLQLKAVPMLFMVHHLELKKQLLLVRLSIGVMLLLKFLKRFMMISKKMLRIVVKLLTMLGQILLENIDKLILKRRVKWMQLLMEKILWKSKKLIFQSTKMASLKQRVILVKMPSMLRQTYYLTFLEALLTLRILT